MKNYNEAKGRNQVVKNFSASCVSEKMQKRISECGNWLDFIADWPVEKLKLAASNFCKWRFCPLCAMRKARVDALRISVLMAYIAETCRKSFIFVTLTAPNVKAGELPREVTRYNKAYWAFMRREEISPICHGYVRKLEITYNRERGDYHPHFHVVIAVNSSYFKSRAYIKQTRWLDLWRECMGDWTITQVDVRAVKPKADAKELSNGFNASEFAKYAAKDEDFTHSAEVFDAFYAALKGRQHLTYSGLFAAANKKYKAGELDEYIKADNTAYYWQVVYTWKGLAYKENKRRALDEADKIFLANKGIDTELVD